MQLGADYDHVVEQPSIKRHALWIAQCCVVDSAWQNVSTSEKGLSLPFFYYSRTCSLSIMKGYKISYFIIFCRWVSSTKLWEDCFLRSYGGSSIKFVMYQAVHLFHSMSVYGKLLRVDSPATVLFSFLLFVSPAYTLENTVI